MLKSLCVLLTLFVASPWATAEIFKCSGDNGKTIYQNFPCNVDSIGSSATAKPPQPEEIPVVATQPARARKVATADTPSVAGLEPRVGMTVKQMKNSAWGQPIDIVKEEVVEGWTQVWYWDLGKKRSVTFDVRGIVSEITQ